MLLIACLTLISYSHHHNAAVHPAEKFPCFSDKLRGTGLGAEARLTELDQLILDIADRELLEESVNIPGARRPAAALPGPPVVAALPGPPAAPAQQPAVPVPGPSTAPVPGPSTAPAPGPSTVRPSTSGPSCYSAELFGSRSLSSLLFNPRQELIEVRHSRHVGKFHHRTAHCRGHHRWSPTGGQGHPFLGD